MKVNNDIADVCLLLRRLGVIDEVVLVSAFLKNAVSKYDWNPL